MLGCEVANGFGLNGFGNEISSETAGSSSQPHTEQNQQKGPRKENEEVDQNFPKTPVGLGILSAGHGDQEDEDVRGQTKGESVRLKIQDESVESKGFHTHESAKNSQQHEESGKPIAWVQNTSQSTVPDSVSVSRHVDLPDEREGVASSFGARPRRDGTEELEQGSSDASYHRAGGRPMFGEVQEAVDTATSIRGGTQPGSQEEVQFGRLCPGNGSAVDGQRDDRPTQGEGNELCLDQDRRSSRGLCGIREVQCPDVPRGPVELSPVLRVGSGDGSGGPIMSKARPLGYLVEDPGSRDAEAQDNNQAPQERDRWSQLEFQLRFGSGPIDQHGGDACSGGEVAQGGQGVPSQDFPIHGRDFFERMGETQPVKEPMPEASMNQAWDLECPVKKLEPSRQRQLHVASERLIPDAFQGLISTGRPILFEVACGPDSVLTSKMQQMTGKKESARRFAYWNGYDLSTSTGVRAVLSEVDKENPQSVWLSLECGPFSKMQNVNQRTPEQREALKEKRANVIKQYVGGLLAYVHCYQKGIPVTWEWSETCDAWRLPMVQRVFERYPPMFCVVKGCRVNLRDLKTKRPLSKGWKLGTTHPRIHDRMSLPCTCQDKVHAPCQGRMTRESAYYTDDFAKRVCRAILEEVGSRELHEELVGHAGTPHFRLGRPVECSCSEVSHPRSSLKCGSCEMKNEKENPLSMAGEADEREEPDLTPEERERALRQISLIHRNTGHGPIENLVKALESRHTDPRIVALARGFRCSICEESKRHVPRPRVSLEPLPPKWNTIQADTALWKHPGTGERCQFAVIIDEGCRFRVGRVMSKGTGFGVSARNLLLFFQESWKPIFGVPSKIRLDPAGAWRSREMNEYWNTLGVELDTIPAEAHWQISHVERAVQCTKAMMDKIAAHDPEVSCEEALSEAIRIENEREVVRGYSPAQHALGRSPDESGRFHESGILGIPPQLCENGEGDFERNSDRMRVAEKAFSDWTHNDRLNRAKNTRSYQVKMFSPGDLVFVWRIQGSGQKRGGFTGPARVLAMETSVSDDGSHYRPGSVVWLVRGARLIKAAPEQLRKASLREECQELLCNPPSLPWTLTKLMDDVGSQQYDDVSGEVPEPMDFEQAVDEENPRPFKRIRHKRYAPECPPPAPSTEDVEIDWDLGEMVDMGEQPEMFLDAYAECFWGQTGSAVEISFEIPETKRGKRNFVENLSSFLASNLKRRNVEVSERTMNEGELEMMKEAKQEEIKKFLSAEALQALPKHLQPDRSTAMKMRWVLTWKRDETNGSRKAKARCVILGYGPPICSSPSGGPNDVSYNTAIVFGDFGEFDVQG